MTLGSRYRRKTKHRLPSKKYGRIALPPKKYRNILVYRFRQSRYRRKLKNRLPPKFYAVLHHRLENTAIFWFTASAKIVTKNEKTANLLKITAVWQYRPACVRLKHRYRPPPSFFTIFSRCTVCGCCVPVYSIKSCSKLCIHAGSHSSRTSRSPLCDSQNGTS